MDKIRHLVENRNLALFHISSTRKTKFNVLFYLHSNSFGQCVSILQIDRNTRIYIFQFLSILVCRRIQSCKQFQFLMICKFSAKIDKVTLCFLVSLLILEKNVLSWCIQSHIFLHFAFLLVISLLTKTPKHRAAQGCKVQEDCDVPCGENKSYINFSRQ